MRGESADEDFSYGHVGGKGMVMAIFASKKPHTSIPPVKSQGEVYGPGRVWYLARLRLVSAGKCQVGKWQ